MQKKVLLVDDESSLIRTLTLGLNQEGYEVESCENGISALKKVESLRNENVDLSTIVLDIKLPDINGVKLGRLIREKYPDTAILFISGHSQKMYESEIENMNMTRFMSKPFSTKDLTYTMDELAVTTQVSPQVKTQEIVEPAKSASAYAMIKIEEGADFFNIYRKLYFMDNILYCDATKGDFDIFMLIQSGSVEACKNICETKINTIPGIKKVDFLEIKEPALYKDLTYLIKTIEGHKEELNLTETSQRDFKHSISSYVVIDFDPAKLSQIYPILKTHEQVIYCDYSHDNQKLMLFINATQFNEIDKIIENEISVLDGVLKVKEYPVISMFEM